ncbi:hypothetical protein N7476_000291 [Penicillium atrosanguineum]|uniref:Uncharacterized protein n=1 Tax=Penicillium atrosanguineum TaxID=1132637 RepID=A0A9W9QDS6_9EURO|nr:hypothetical protein N7476_000291 [Penicillium atrosanguineum]
MCFIPRNLRSYQETDISQMTQPLSRVKREQLRKRRNNLLRRHNEFWLLYGIKTWLIMEQPDGQIFTYHSHPDVRPPSKYETGNRSGVNRTPADYDASKSAQPVDRKLPVFSTPNRQHDIWRELAEYLKNNRPTDM